MQSFYQETITRLPFDFVRPAAIMPCVMPLAHYMAPKSRRTLQNKDRINVVPVQLTLFVNAYVAFKNAFFYSFLPNGPDNCSEIHALQHLVMEN